MRQILKPKFSFSRNKLEAPRTKRNERFVRYELLNAAQGSTNTNIYYINLIVFSYKNAFRLRLILSQVTG